MNLKANRAGLAPMVLAIAAAVAAGIAVAGCGSGNSTYSPLAKTGGPTPGFSLALSPSTASVVAGNSANYTVTITNTGGFNSPVTLSASNLPAGATATFGNPTVTATGSTVPLTIATTVELAAARPKAAPGRLVGTGNTTFTVTGSSNGVIESTTAVISITGAPDFSLTITPRTTTVQATDTANYTVTVTTFGGFAASSVVLSITQGLPANTRATFGTPTATSTGETVPLAIATSTDDATPPGNSAFTVSGTGGGLTRTANGALDVTDFSITVSPASQSTRQGGSVTYTVTLTALNGYNSKVNLTASSLPTGVTATFSSTTVTPTASGATVTLTYSTTSSTPAGGPTTTYVNAVNNDLGRSAPAALTVTGSSSSDFSVAISPTTGFVESGNTVNYVITVTPTGGLDVSGVTLAGPTGLPANAVAVFGTPVTTSTNKQFPLTIESSIGGATPPASTPFTISASGSGKTHTVTGNLAVTNFTVAVSPSSQTSSTGNTVTYNVTVTALDGYAWQTSLQVSGLPTAGVTATFADPVITPTAAGVTTTLTITTNAATTPTGSYTLKVTGTDIHFGSLSNSGTATLKLQGG